MIQPLKTARFSKLLARSYYSYSFDPIHPLPNRKTQWLSADEAVKTVKSGKSFAFYYSLNTFYIHEALNFMFVQMQISELE